MKKFFFLFVILIFIPVMEVFASYVVTLEPVWGYYLYQKAGIPTLEIYTSSNSHFYEYSCVSVDNLSSIESIVFNCSSDAISNYVDSNNSIYFYGTNENIFDLNSGSYSDTFVYLNSWSFKHYKGNKCNVTKDLTSYFSGDALNYKYIVLAFRSGVSWGGYVYNISYDITRTMPESTPTPEPMPEPTPSPSSSGEASPVPTTPPTLDDYNFYSYCYDGVWKDGDTLTKTITQKFVPSSTSDFSSDKVGIYNNLLVFNVRIPFRVECSGFNGMAVFDANYKFDLDCEIMELSENVSSLVDFSTPWIESSDTNFSFNATNSSPYGFGFDVINMSLNNSTTAEFYYCFNAYVSLYSNALFTNHGQYINIKLSNINFNVLSSSVISPVSSADILQSIDKGIQDGNAQEKQFHDEELQKTNEAIDQLNNGVSQVTDVLSKWEIVTMPVTLVGNFADAIKSDGSTGLTFPSFSLMGFQIWPAYTFDLNFVKENFPLLYNSLHIVSGILIVIGFVRYLWRKWALLVGDDMPEEKG